MFALKKYRNARQLLTFVAALLPFFANAQLVITPGTQLPTGWTADSLVRNVLLGSGVTVSNVRFNGSSGVINCDAIGKFTTGTLPTTLGMEEGIIIGSGDVSGAIGPNDECCTTEDVSCNSYSCTPLANLVNNTLNDIAVLEFDFTPTTDSIQFEYIFGSEEYPDYVCAGYNDVFGFFLTGQNPVAGQPAYNNKNIALLPNSNIPISINTVNDGSGSLWGGSDDDCDYTNSAYYVDNDGGQYVEYNGYTVVLTASASVVPHTVYHLIMAVADAGDSSFDTGVFLKANSLTSVSDTIIDTICYGECYQFFDTTICDPGVYVHEEGLSIVTLFLAIRHYPIHYQNDVIVQNQLPWTYAGQTFYGPVQNDSIILTDRYGCDSLLVFNLVVHNNSNSESDTTICASSLPLTWHGHTFYSAGTVIDTLSGRYGVDSTVVYRVYVNQTYTRDDYATICKGSVYEYNGQFFSTQGIHPVRFYTNNGCDSTLYLHLTVLENPEAQIRFEPEMADLENQSISIFDQSPNSSWREWIINGEGYGGDIVINYNYPIDHDSVIVQLISHNGPECVDTTYTVIYMDRCAMWVPNVFTPGAAINSIFFPVGPCITELELWIYNRDGAQVYHTTNISDFWDGRNQRTGEECPTGSYVYTMNYRMSNYPDVKRTSTGTVMLLR